MNISIADLLSGDEKIWERFVSLYRGILIKFVYSCVLDLDVAEDIVQEVFLVVWKRLHALPENSDLKKYMFKCARNLCWNHLRDMHLHTVPIEELELTDIYRRGNIHLLEGDILNKLFEDDLQKIIKGFLDKMPSQTREIFLMSRTRNLSNKEIARNMNLSEKAIEYHISKAIRLIRQRLPEEYWLLLLFPLL